MGLGLGDSRKRKHYMIQDYASASRDRHTQPSAVSNDTSLMIIRPELYSVFSFYCNLTLTPNPTPVGHTPNAAHVPKADHVANAWTVPSWERLFGPSRPGF